MRGLRGNEWNVAIVVTASVSALRTRANSHQFEATLAIDLAALIVAGSGSNRAFTLIERIPYLITEQSVTGSGQ
jgi:hypothetical protein